MFRAIPDFGHINLISRNILTKYFSSIPPSQHNCDPNYVKKIISRRGVHLDRTPLKNADDESSARRKSNSSDESRCKKIICRKARTILVAIVGGGYTPMYTTLLLKQNPAIREIHVIDTNDSLASPVCDMRQIDTSATVKHYKMKHIIDGLRNVDIVALMDESDFSLGNKGPYNQFTSCFDYVKKNTECMVKACPDAIVAVFTRPVTATVPLISEVFKKSGIWDPNKIIGSAALESIRITSMMANHLNLSPSSVKVPIAGGVDSSTTVPLLSRIQPSYDFSIEDQCSFIHQFKAIDEKIHETEQKSPILSSSVAAAKFLSSLVNGLDGHAVAMENAYVRSDVLPFCPYMTSEVLFGPNGVKKNFGLPKISARDVALVEQAASMIGKITDTVGRFVSTGRVENKANE
ncbi:hypothetical protein QAD02_001837 [Eretmocerus hayati]|uniref:Uncharacterized protein n=1 Tax=Eretmocerus hayati TaxID=131215 RepID=A0ACC2NIF9_9HYME|nr:hypothetical protein QAD02_001837 [Eretmocerus hayati]